MRMSLNVIDDDINARRKELILEKLTLSLKPLDIEVIDESAAHANHAGAKEHGGGHFKLSITSEMFNEKTELERHRMIYAVLGEAVGQEIHALSIKALTPVENEQESQSPETEE